MNRQALIQSHRFTGLGGTFRLYFMGLSLVAFWACLLGWDYGESFVFRYTPLLVGFLVVLQYTLRLEDFSNEEVSFLLEAETRMHVVQLLSWDSVRHVNRSRVLEAVSIFQSLLLEDLNRSLRRHALAALMGVVLVAVVRIGVFAVGESAGWLLGLSDTLLGLLVTFELFRIFKIRSTIASIAQVKSGHHNGECSEIERNECS